MRLQSGPREGCLCRARFALALAVLFVAPTFAQTTAPVIVNSLGYINGTPLTVHTSAAFDSTGASTLVAFVSANNSWNGLPVGIAGLTDSQSNDWTLLAGPTTFVGSSFGLVSAVYYLHGPATSAHHTLSVQLSNPAPLVFHVFAVSGSDVTRPPMVSAITDPGTGNVSATVTGAPIVVPGNTLLLGWAKNETSATATAIDGYSLDPQSTSFLWAESQTASSAGSYSSGFQYDSPIGWQTAMVGLAASAGPGAFNQSVIAKFNTPMGVTLRASSPQGLPLTYTVLTNPARGVLSGTAPNLTYSPDANYVGPDSFTFKANDGASDSNTATISINVQGPVSAMGSVGYDNSTPLTTHTSGAFSSTGASTLVAFVSTHPSWDGLPVSLQGVSDNQGNAWNLLTGPATFAGSSFTLLSAIYYLNSPNTSGSHTVSVQLTNPAPLVFHVFAVAGSDVAGPPVFSTITDPGTGNVSATVGTSAIMVPNDALLIAWVKNELSAAATAIDGYTLDPQSQPFLWAESETVANAGSYAGQFEYSAPVGWQTAIVGLKMPGGGPPSPTLTATPPELTSQTSASFSFSDTQSGTTFLCQLDGSAFAGCSSPAAYANLAQGVHTFGVKAQDGAGNQSGAATYSWTVDTTPPPSPTLTSTPANPTTQTSASFGFTDTESGAGFLCQLDGAGFNVCSNPAAYSALSQGTHTFSVMAADAAGNQSGPASFVWTIQASAGIAFVQGVSATPQGQAQTVTVTLPAGQTAGDLNVVAVGWNDATAAVQSVTDSAGNSYKLAIGPTVGTELQQSIYYASTVRGGANAVTVTFSQPASFPDIRVLEYRGVNALDVSSGAKGNSTTPNSGPAATNVADELIFGANTVATTTKAPGAGFTSRVITSPNGDLAEDKVVSISGSNSVGSTLTSRGPWVMQMATFFETTGPGPTVSTVSPASGPATGTTPVTITGTNFSSGARVMFGTNAATNVVVVSGTTITATAPSGPSGLTAVTVTVNGQNGMLNNAFTYVPPPSLTSVLPPSGPPAGGTAVTITGNNFLSGATVLFGSTEAANVSVVSATAITATSPPGLAGTAAVTVKNPDGQIGSLSSGFIYGPPTVVGVSPPSGPTVGGTAVTITGSNFASGATVMFGAAAALNVTVKNGTTITATAPAGSAGPVTLTVTNPGSQGGSLGNAYTYVVVPTIKSISPGTGPLAGGTTVTITGTNFGPGATVTFGGTPATGVTVASSTSITATTPAHLPGPVAVRVTVNGQAGSLANAFTYTYFVQVASATPQTSTATVAVSFPKAEVSGDLNVVIVGWNDTTATVQSVTDSAGNVYHLALGPTLGTGLQQSIYYASGIAGGSRTITVVFSRAALLPDVRALEYRGIGTPDMTAGAAGNSSTAACGPATTSAANELIVAADTVATGNASAGRGFTRRVLTSPDSDLAEDQAVTAAGAYNATANLRSSGPWVMQMVSFK